MTLLYPLIFIYRILNKIDKSLKIRRRKSLDKPVISIGNLEMGGVGKTQIVEYIANRLINSGKRVAILSRGYGGKFKGIVVADNEKAGDEVRMLKMKIPKAIVIAHPCRYMAKEILKINKTEIDIYLLDDGFQHYQLKRDIDIVLLDWKNPNANGFFPMGSCREDLSSLRRADMIIFTRAEKNQITGFDIKKFYKNELNFCDFKFKKILFNGNELDKDRRYFLLTAIAKPYKLLDSLKREKINIIDYKFFRDHHRYTDKDINQIKNNMLEKECEFLLTTYKDIVKINIPAAIIESELIWLNKDGEENLFRRIRKYAEF